MEDKAVLETYLHQLRIPTFVQNYQAFAQDAARSNLSFERYLFALCEAEIAQREANRVERCIANAKFPVLKRAHNSEHICSCCASTPSHFMRASGSEKMVTHIVFRGDRMTITLQLGEGLLP